MSSEHKVSNEDADIRLDRWFRRHYPGLPHALLEKYLRKGLVRLDGKKAKSSDRVYAQQTIEIRVQDSGFGIQGEKKKRLVAPADAKMLRDAVLYTDADIVVINKPYGLAVQGGTKISKSIDDMLDALMFDAKERPKLVHRLDRDTSGCLVLARNAKVAAQLARGFSGKSIEKTYWALVNGCPLQLAGTIDLRLRKAARADAREQVMVDEEEGDRAITEYRVIDQLARKFALMELKPLTGRTHQLRVHMAAIGCPIVGDHKYGGSMEDAKALGVENILHLHARRIVIPIEKRRAIDVTAPLPEHMKRSFKALGLDIPKK